MVRWLIHNRRHSVEIRYSHTERKTLLCSWQPLPEQNQVEKKIRKRVDRKIFRQFCIIFSFVNNKSSLREGKKKRNYKRRFIVEWDLGDEISVSRFWEWKWSFVIGRKVRKTAWLMMWEIEIWKMCLKLLKSFRAFKCWLDCLFIR